MYGPLPPTGFAVAVPLQLLKHVAFVNELIFATTPGVFGTLTIAVSVQPFASVTKTVYKPAT